MNQLVPMRSRGLSRSDSRKLSLFQSTVGKELRGAEIDEAIEWCEIYGANPFVRDIYFFVFDAEKPTRNVVPVLSIGLYRKIANRTGNYRPDSKPARFRYDEALKSPSNPAGMLDCEVSLYLYSHGEWFEVTERIRWEERAPVKEIWESGIATGKFRLDPKKKNWREMPETMMSKCVEAAVIRKAFPEQTSGSYSEGELDRAEVLNLTATEIIEQEQSRQRFERIGGPNCITISWDIDGTLSREPTGTFGDKVLKFIKEHEEEPFFVLAFADRNKDPLKEYWAHDKSGALAVKAALEKFEVHRPKQEAAE
ncbi:MAG: phage recombination protein Bet [Betaproteobacteria bacterium]